MDYVVVRFEDELEHHGVKGQRWGVIRSPEQLGHKPKAKRKKSASGQSKSIAVSAKKKRSSKSVKVSRKEQKQKEKEVKAKEKSMRSPTTMYRNRNKVDFTKEELDEAMKRFERDKKLSDYSRDEISRGQKYWDTAIKYGDNAIKTYNMFAKVYNSFYDGDLPIIKDTGNKDKDKG